MNRDPAPRRRWPLLAVGSLAGAEAPRVPALSLPLWLRLPRLRVAQHPRAARLALGTILAGAFLVVAYATADQNVIVPGSYLAFPPWESGPLHLLFKHLPVDQMAINWGFSAVLLIMLGAWVVLASAVRGLSMRTIAIAILVLHAVVLFMPPVQLNDVFNYLGYARLGALHGLNPYTHVIGNELHDPVTRFASWKNLHSPYGPLFTALTYPLGLVSLPVAYWILKTTTMAFSLGLIGLVYRIARQLGRDPRFAVAFLALNPIYVIYAMGGFHNDFFMLVPMAGAISLVLARRDRSAGAMIMLAVAVKFTSGLLLPFMFFGVRGFRRRRDIVIGAVMAGIPLLALSLGLFGAHLPNLSDQSTLLTNFSFPELIGLAFGFGGGAPVVLKVFSVLLVLCVVWLLRQRGDWIARAGWATVALLVSLSWLMPWYAIWILPLAGLGTSVRLRKAAVLMSVFLVLTFVPGWGIVLWSHGLDPMNTAVGHASNRLQNQLAQFKG